MRKRTIIKINIKAYKCIREHGLIIDMQGIVWRLPYKSERGLLPILPLKIYKHNKHRAIVVKRKILNFDILENCATRCNISKIYEIEEKKVPDNMHKYIIK